ncbi:MAG: sensor domain-containing diguanylate cyclase [Steroidobacteraceae bacterium]
MQQPATPADETQRLRALQSLKVLDTLPEERFDRITRLAARLLKVPIVLVSLVDSDRQWFKSRLGLDTCQTSRDISFCGHAILEEGPLIVPDCLQDARFADNPLVTDEPLIRFYAGHPIHAPDGSRVGTLCAIDREPRQITPQELETLADLTAMVSHELSLLARASVDELTQLSNRRGFIDVAQHVLALCKRFGQQAVLVTFDLNHFKSINDTLGHAAGDQVLRMFGTLLLKQFRSSDVVARLGGDEFAVLGSAVTAASMTQALDRLQNAFAASDLGSRHPDLSWSSGIAEFNPASKGTIDDLLRAADQKMYGEKGRER